MAEPKSYRFPEDLIERIEEQVAPNGPYASRTAFFAEAAEEKLDRLDKEEEERLQAQHSLSAGVLPTGWVLLPFHEVLPGARGSAEVSLEVEASGRSPRMTLETIPDARVLRFGNLYVRGLPPEGEEGGVAVIAQMAKIGGSPNLLPGGNHALLSSYDFLDIPNFATDDVLSRSGVDERYLRTPGLIAQPVLVMPNSATVIVQAVGRPGDRVKFALFALAQNLRDDRPPTDA